MSNIIEENKMEEIIDQQRCMMLRSIIEVSPIALDIVVAQDGEISLYITVLKIAKNAPSNNFNIHQSILKNDPNLLLSFLMSGDYNVNEYDHHGNTPLHLACILGRYECVLILLRHCAIPILRNKKFWTAFQEATSYGNRDIIERVWFANRKINETTLRARKKEILEELDQKSADFYLNIHWQFSSWIPFVNRFCPEDNLIIYKRGSSIRVDFSIIGFEGFSWKRGDRSFIFAIDPKTSRSTSYLMDNKLKHYESLDEILNSDNNKRRQRAKIAWKRFQTISEEHDKPDDSDLEFSDWETAKNHPELGQILSDEVDLLMSSPITDSSSPGVLNFKQVKTGYFMFQKNLIETVGNYDSRVFEVSNINWQVQKRTEHLDDDDLERLNQFSSMFSFNSSNKKENLKITDEEIDKANKEAEDGLNKFENARKLFEIKSSRASVPPPKESEISFEEYLQNSNKIGRKQVVSQTDKQFEAKIWMADDFPLSVKDLLRILSVIAPHHPSIEKLRQFISERLPAGFPIQVSIPVFPTLKAEIRFDEYYERTQAPELFQVPDDYIEQTLPSFLSSE